MTNALMWREDSTNFLQQHQRRIQTNPLNVWSEPCVSLLFKCLFLCYQSCTDVEIQNPNFPAHIGRGHGRAFAGGVRKSHSLWTSTESNHTSRVASTAL